MMRTIHAAAEEIRQGRLSPVDLLETCLQRIEQVEPRVRAWVFVDRDGARAEAKRCADEVRRGQWRGPLHGVPLGIKDIIDVFDWPTAAGSRLWANSIARQDATVVRRLRAAGAVFVGKTVTTQYASFDPPPTRNPWNPERTPGGSSSGSAAAEPLLEPAGVLLRRCRLQADLWPRQHAWRRAPGTFDGSPRPHGPLRPGSRSAAPGDRWP